MACHVSLTWLAMCHSHGSPYVTHMARHVSPTWLAMCSSTPIFSKYVKFRLSWNSTKFDWVARFRETIPTMQPFRHPRSRKILTFLWTIPINYSFAPFLSKKFKFKIFTSFTKTLHSLCGFEPILVWSYEIGNYNIEKFYLRSLDFKRDRL